MALVKCPRCELNYMKEGDKYCTVCARELRGVDDSHEHVEICLVCGEHPAQPGSELCAQCLREHKRIGEEQEDAFGDEAAEEILDETDDLEGMTEIDMEPSDAPESELEDMEREFGSPDETDMDDDAEEEDDDLEL